MILQSLKSREILDSRGNPTVEVDALIAGSFGKTFAGRASVPSGASTGSYEACELRDGNPKRYFGKGVLNAIDHIQTMIAPALLGQTLSNQAALDQQLCELDNTSNKSRLGANALLAVSLAIAKALAAHADMPLHDHLAQAFKKPLLMPVPMMNILNGGAHADNNVDIQEFMILPVGANSFSEALQMGVEVFHTLKTQLKLQGLSTAVGDEGGFAPNLRSNTEALDFLLAAIEKAGFRAGHDIYLGLDIASTEFYKNGQYILASENKSFSSDEWIDTLTHWVSQYPIISIEDGMAENDWAGWIALTKRLGQAVQLVGDDLFVTNPKLLQRGIQEKAANAILVKLNQIGTLSETQEAIILAQNNHYAAVISHRSGETEDTTIADLAVASGVGQIKAGAPCRTDRTAKYNQLLRIENLAYNPIPYAGKHAFKRLLSP